MSFSSDVKAELARVTAGDTKEIRAEIAGILIGCASICKIKNMDVLRVETENSRLARKYFTLVKKTYKIDIVLSVEKTNRIGRKSIYHVDITDAYSTGQLLADTHVSRDGAFLRIADESLIESVETKAAFARGIFLASGTVSNPEKSYHFEINCKSMVDADIVRMCLEALDTAPKIVCRKDEFVVYIKGSDMISLLLGHMGAINSLMAFENVRIMKDVKNKVHRRVNCETANIKKTVSAAVEQIKDIEKISEKIGLKALPPMLYDIAQARLANPQATLIDLGESMTPPISKSCVNHRLRKISELADSL